MDDLLEEFIAETRETLEALAGEIVMWEADPSNRERLDAIFRFVHTVKGSCGFLDLPRLSRLSHAAEDVLSAVRSGTRTPDASLVTAVLAIVDRIGDIIEAIDAGAALDDSGEDLLIAALAEGAESADIHSPTMTVTRAPTRSVRLNVDLLDRMMSGMSDMVLARNELVRRLRHDAVEPAVEAALERLSMTVAEMRDTVTRTRMQKIDALFSALPRMVRDTAAELGKSISLAIEGADVELDREMIEMMRDPLVHIIRNAIDHGIEMPAERIAAGKPETGRLTVAARQSGNQIIIEMIDDGKGIDVDRLIAKVAAAGQRSEAELHALPARAKLDLIFQPGISTKSEVTEISGRGVGMDVVRANIEQIGGRIDLNNRPGQGLTIAIHVPLTLSIIPAIVVGVDDQRFALPRQMVEEIVAMRGDAIRVHMLGDSAVATVRGRRMPLVDLASALKLPGGKGPRSGMLVIIGINGGSYALAVDSVLDTEELVIKPAAPAVMASGLYAGQTLPDTGQPMLLLDGAGIAASKGVYFNRETMGHDEAAVASASDEQGIAALLFLDLDGARRAVPLSIVDRVEVIPVAHIRHSAGKLRWSTDGGILPIVACRSLDDRVEVGVLRLHDGATEIGYAMKEAIDILTLPEVMMPARNAGPMAGVVAIDGDQIEVLDVHWLFAEHGEADVTHRGAPLCLLAGAGASWMETFLRPVIESAGYRVATSLAGDELPTITLAMDDEEVTELTSAPVVRLSSRKTSESGKDGAIYRYDRDRLLCALAERRAAGGGR
jgi:two-component system chemotaxis sensor kinase CheA